jgi:hypothetical protein
LELVLDSVADDYESLEIILGCINKPEANLESEPWVARNPAPVSRPDVVEALRVLIREGYVQAYMLNTEEPYTQAVDFREEAVDDLWFYVTPKGKLTVDKFYDLSLGRS